MTHHLYSWLILHWKVLMQILFLRIRAIALDNNTESITVTMYPGPGYSSPYFSQTLANPIDPLFDLSVGEGGYRNIIFTAKDKSGKMARDTVMLSVESSPHLQKVYSAAGPIVDFNYNKVLSYNTGIGHVADISTGQSVNIPFTNKISNEPYLSFITPYGVIFKEANNNNLWDWNNDSLHLLGTSDYGLLKINGNFATWSTIPPSTPSTAYPAYLYLRDLTTHTNKLVFDYAKGGRATVDLSQNGRMAITSFTDDVVRYRNDTFGYITADGNLHWDSGPQTDGINIIFAKNQRNNYATTNAGIYLWDGISLTEISSFDYEWPGNQPRGKIDYQLNGKWMSYVRKDAATNLYQIWLRDSAGTTNTQRTFFDTRSSIDLLNPSGDFIGIRNSQRFLLKNGGFETKELASTVGTTYYRDSTWYIVLA